MQYCFGNYLHKDSDSLTIRDAREKRVNEFRHKLENTNWDLSDLAYMAGVKRGGGRGNLGTRGRMERNACKDAIVFSIFHAQILSMKIVIGQN